MTVFNVSIPSVGPGALECRETHEDLTKPEPSHLRPASDFYRTIALEFTAAQVSCLYKREVHKIGISN